jgi:hypothetical protein
VRGEVGDGLWNGGLVEGIESMKEEARRILLEVVREEGEGAWKNWETCQGLMKDYGGMSMGNTNTNTK